MQLFCTTELINFKWITTIELKRTRAYIDSKQCILGLTETSETVKNYYYYLVCINQFFSLALNQNNNYRLELRLFIPSLSQCKGEFSIYIENISIVWWFHKSINRDFSEGWRKVYWKFLIYAKTVVIIVKNVFASILIASHKFLFNFNGSSQKQNSRMAIYVLE